MILPPPPNPSAMILLHSFTKPCVVRPQVILCSDGKPNLGLGALDGAGKGANFYSDVVAMKAKQSEVSISSGYSELLHQILFCGRRNVDFVPTDCQFVARFPFPCFPSPSTTPLHPSHCALTCFFSAASPTLRYRSLKTMIRSWQYPDSRTAVL